jgi:hypothetical protein
MDWPDKGVLAGVAAGAASDDQLCDAAVVLARLGSLVAAVQGGLLAEMETRRVCEDEFGLTTATWLAREAAVPLASARQAVRVGATLRSHLSDVHDAVVDGRLGWHHGRVLAEACTPRVAEPLAELQGEVIALAGLCSFERWRAEMRGIVERLDEDGGHDPNEDLARNKLRLSDTIDGILVVSGQLVGEQALAVREAIEARADELWRRFEADHERCPDITVPGRATMRALALAELCRAGGAVDVQTTRPPRPEITLVVPASGPVATADVDDLTGGSVAPARIGSARARRSDGVPLADGTTRVLRCDADLFAVVVDSLGVPLDLGRRVRRATAAQRRAIAVRDGGCVFPGCDLPPHWCDAHHVVPFEAGGATDVSQLASLCRRHHGVTHRAGWQMDATADGWFSWTTPTGRTFWSQRHGRRRRDSPPAAAA